MSKCYPWIPTNLPKNWPYTPHRDGWTRWYSGRTVFVAGKTVPLSKVEDKWIEKKRAIDLENLTPVTAPALEIDPTTQMAVAKPAAVLSFIEMASLFYSFNDTRVSTGKPKRMSKYTAWDYQRIINELGAAIGPDKAVREIGPADFSRYAALIAHSSMSRYSVKVGCIEAFVRWAMTSGYFADNAALESMPLGVTDPVRYLIGPSLIKPSKEDIRDERIVETYSYAPQELRALWRAASELERLWISLGLTCAFDNADLSHLIQPMINFNDGTIDYRRRKRGKIRRFVPIHPGILAAMREYRRPPAVADDDEDRFFLTPTGLTLQRLGKGGQIDYVAMQWTRLMCKAGLRPEAIVTKAKDSPDGRRHIKMPEEHEADGRGFRGLRTTFPNLAPAGFREEIEIIMGHAHGGVLLDHYLEKFGVERLKRCVTHVWHRAFACPTPPGEECRCPCAEGGSVGPRLSSAA